MAIFRCLKHHFRPNNLSSDLPIFLCLPCFVSGIPVFLEILPLAAEIPNALFQENEKPCFLPISHLSAFSHLID